MQTCAACVIDPAVSISSSTITTWQPSTDPIRFSTSRAILVADPPLLDDRERGIEDLGEVAGPFGVAEVRRDDDRVLQPLLDEVVGGQEHRAHLIDRNIEKALDLPGVEIDRQHAVGAGNADQLGDQAGGDRHARLILLVGAAVAEVGDDRRDPAGRSALAACRS